MSPTEAGVLRDPTSTGCAGSAIEMKLPCETRGFAPKTGGIVGAFLLGALTGVIASPCAMPVLAVLLSYVAAKGNVVYGGLLLFTYALGHSLLVLIAGSSIGIAEAMVNSKGLKKASTILKKASGVLLLLVAAYFLYDIFKR